ncbi:Eukaryotic aspartyl protease [Aphelenchoides fujianensis]|nr:Eukaryotic aspartyl protease [Aphelenchoides fujianensis]
MMYIRLCYRNSRITITCTPFQPRFYSFSCRQSSTSQKTNCCWTGLSDNFDLTGRRYSDRILFYSLNLQRKAVNQSFSTVQLFYQDLQPIAPTFDFDGVLGLAWTETTDPPPPLINILRSIPHLQANYSVVWLEKPTSADSKPTASIAFGLPNDHCNSEFHALNLVFVPTPANSIPAVAVDAFTFADYSYTNAGTATLNLGQPVVLFPLEVVGVLLNSMNADYDWYLGVYTIDCSNAGNLADWVFHMGGWNYAIPSSTYIYDIGLDNGCVVAFDQLNDYSRTDFALGSVFFHEFCLKLDVDNQQFAFSTAIQMS